MSALETVARATMTNLTVYEALIRCDGVSLLLHRVYAEYERQERVRLLARLAELLRARAAIVDKWQMAYFAGELDGQLRSRSTTR